MNGPGGWYLEGPVFLYFSFALQIYLYTSAVGRSHCMCAFITTSVALTKYYIIIFHRNVSPRVPIYRHRPSPCPCLYSFSDKKAVYFAKIYRKNCVHVAFGQMAPGPRLNGGFCYLISMNQYVLLPCHALAIFYPGTELFTIVKIVNGCDGPNILCATDRKLHICDEEKE